MTTLNRNDLSTLEATATKAAAYLDACDSGAQYVRLDPKYYQACAHLLMAVFNLTNASASFPELVKNSAAARELAESLEIERRIEISRLGYYPQLELALSRASA